MSKKTTASNAKRVESAGICLMINREGESIEDPTREDVVDLLTNLRHFCAFNKWDFMKLEDIANKHFIAES